MRTVTFGIRWMCTWNINKESVLKKIFIIDLDEELNNFKKTERLFFFIIKNDNLRTI